MRMKNEDRLQRLQRWKDVMEPDAERRSGVASVEGQTIVFVRSFVRSLCFFYAIKASLRGILQFCSHQASFTSCLDTAGVCVDPCARPPAVEPAVSCLLSQ